MSTYVRNRLCEVMGIARDLGWVQPTRNSHGTIDAADVEKLLLCAMDDDQLARFRGYAGDKTKEFNFKRLCAS